MLADAIARYHDLLGSDNLAADSQEQLDRLTKLRQLYFGDRPVCAVLRPRFLTATQFHFLQQAVQARLPAFARLYKRALADPGLRNQFGLVDVEGEWLA